MKERSIDLPNLDKHLLWNFVIFGSASFLLFSLIIFFIVCCKDFDAKTAFEIRRRFMTKQKKKEEKKKA